MSFLTLYSGRVSFHLCREESLGGKTPNPWKNHYSLLSDLQYIRNEFYCMNAHLALSAHTSSFRDSR